MTKLSTKKLFIGVKDSVCVCFVCPGIDGYNACVHSETQSTTAESKNVSIAPLWKSCCFFIDTNVEVTIRAIDIIFDHDKH